jgi:hypothetical protein
MHVAAKPLAAVSEIVAKKTRFREIIVASSRTANIIARFLEGRISFDGWNFVPVVTIVVALVSVAIIYREQTSGSLAN